MPVVPVAPLLPSARVGPARRRGSQRALGTVSAAAGRHCSSSFTASAWPWCDAPTRVLQARAGTGDVPGVTRPAAGCAVSPTPEAQGLTGPDAPRSGVRQRPAWLWAAAGVRARLLQVQPR